LNELAAALGDDPNFATTVTNSIATKLPLAGGTLTGALQAQPWLFRQMSNQVEYHVLDNGNLNGPSWKFRYDGTTSNRYVDFGFKDGAGNYVSGLKLHNNSTVYWRGADIINGNAQWVGDINTSASIQTGAIEASGNVTVGNSGNINIPTASSGNANLHFDGTDFKITSNSSSANLKLETNSTTRLTINNAGNVTLNSATDLDFQVADFAQIKFRESGAIMIDSDNNQSSRNFSIKDGDGTNLLLITDTGNATFAGEVSLKSRLNLQRSSGGATTLIQFKNENGVDRAHIDFGGTNEELSFFSGSGGSEHMRIDGSGNVGINNTNPSAFNSLGGLQTVIGNGSANANLTLYGASTDYSHVAFADSSTSGSSAQYAGLLQYYHVDNSLKIYTNSIERIKINDAGNVFISTPVINAFYGLSLTYNSNNTADFTVNQATGQIKIGGVLAGYYPTFYAGGSERMRITSGGDIQVQGGDIFLNSGTNYNDKGVVYLSNERTAIISDIVNATANGDTSLDFQTRKGGTRASALFIDQFRNSVFSFSVGIGMTPAADAKLEIADGSFRIRGNQTHSIQLANSSGNTRSALGQAGNEGDLSLYRSNNVKHVYLSSYYNSYINPSNGNLGIGTTSPNNGKLEVQQTAITPALWVQTGGTTDTYYIADFRTGTNASALAIKGNGRVGVGESTPAEKLEVNGNIKAADTTGKFFTNAYSFSGVVLVDFFQHTNDGIWEYTLKVNPNTAGSGSYIDYYYGKIGVGIGWSGSNVTQYLWHQPTNTAPRTLYNSGGGNLGLSFQMLHSGSVYTTLPLNTGPWYLRLTGLGTSVSGEIFFRRLA